MTTKYEEAVRRATGGQSEESTSSGRVTNPMISEFQDGELAEMLSNGEWEFAPQVMSLEEGQKVEGILEGNGPMAEIRDRDTGEVKEVATWIIASKDGTQRVSILSSAQLDKKLPPFIGGLVKIVRGKDIKISNGHRCTEYLVGGPKLANGQRRSWVAKPVLDVPAQVKELPATTSATPTTAGTTAAETNGASA